MDIENLSFSMSEEEEGEKINFDQLEQKYQDIQQGQPKQEKETLYFRKKKKVRLQDVIESEEEYE